MTWDPNKHPRVPGDGPGGAPGGQFTRVSGVESAKSLRQQVTVIETKDGWLHAQHGRKFKTLAAVVRAIKKDAAIAAARQNVITTITYVPNTRVGAALVQSLVQPPEKK